MANVTGSITVRTSFTQVRADLPGGASSLPVPQAFGVDFTAASGVLLDQVNDKYTARLNFAGAPIPLDLTALLDVFGGAVNFARVKSISIVILSNNPAHVLLFGYSVTTANAWTAFLSNPGQITLRPSTTINQGFLVVGAPDATGYPVSGSSKLIQFDPGANTFSAAIEITGTSV